MLRFATVLLFMIGFTLSAFAQWKTHQKNSPWQQIEVFTNFLLNYDNPTEPDQEDLKRPQKDLFYSNPSLEVNVDYRLRSLFSLSPGLLFSWGNTSENITLAAPDGGTIPLSNTINNDYSFLLFAMEPN